jgi:ABC-2 type transport system ATP-binding protein
LTQRDIFLLAHPNQLEQVKEVPKAISVNNLTKVYGNGFKAVDGISFDVAEGEIFGLLGPNGAGKTTTIKILTTMIKQTSGTAIVAGLDVNHHPKEVRQIVSYVPQSISVDGDLTAYENLLVFGKLFYVNRSDLSSRIDSALEYMGLSGRKNDLAKQFSGGMMRRLEIAQALVNRPKVMILDEPSLGLDPSSKKQISSYVKRVNSEFKTTVLITTHDMMEADELCDKIAIMNAGKISVIGPPKELKKSVGGDVITVTLSKTVLSNSAYPIHVIPPAIGSLISTEKDTTTMKILCESGEHTIPRLMDYLEKNSFSVEKISLSKPTLEDAFMKYAKTSLDSDTTGDFRETRATRRSFARRSN